MSAPRRSRSALASGKIDSIFESERVNPKVTKKIKESLGEYQKLREEKTKRKGHGPIENLNGPGTRDPAIRALGPQSKKERLSPMQRKYVEAVSQDGLSKRQAAKAAGYSSPRTAIQSLDKLPIVQDSIARERQACEEELNMTRKKVVDGLMEAIDIGRIKADPLSMVAGWREVAKICGYYEPIKHKIEVSVNGQVLLNQITTMSDEDLLKLADEAAIIDGEYTQLPRHQEEEQDD
jgi:phage terminase small subunit